MVRRVGDGASGMDRWGQMRHLTSGLPRGIIRPKKMMVVLIHEKKNGCKKQSDLTVRKSNLVLIFTQNNTYLIGAVTLLNFRDASGRPRLRL